MNKILVYTRPYSASVLCKAASAAFEEPSIVTISEYPKSFDHWVGDYIYKSDYDVPILDAELLSDIVCRDRALREMEPTRAARIVQRFWNGCERLFAGEKFDYLLSMTPDCYCPDVLIRVATKHGVKTLAPMGTFLKDEYARFTLYGERVDLGRMVSDQEASDVLERMLDKTFLPKSEIDNIKRSAKDVKSFYRRRKLIESVYHPVKRTLTRDPDNPRWNTSLFKKTPFEKLYSRDYESYFTSIDDIDFSAQPTAYLPMHLIPEATTDYFCKNIAREGYCNYILRVAREKDAGIRLLIKEHPAMYGRRELSFYDELLKVPEVSIIHPLIRSNDLLDRIDLVVVDNGTVGVEAAIRGKRVLALESNYYSDLHPNIHVQRYIGKELFSVPLVDYDDARFMKDLLSSMFPSNFCDVGMQMKDLDAQSLAEGIRLFVECS